MTQPRCDRTFVHKDHDVTDAGRQAYRCPGLTQAEADEAVRVWLDGQTATEAVEDHVQTSGGPDQGVTIGLNHGPNPDVDWNLYQRRGQMSFTIGRNWFRGGTAGINVPPAPRDPWALQVPYDVLHAGLRALGAMALAEDDYETAAYAYSVLAGKPIPPDDDPEDEPAPQLFPMQDNGRYEIPYAVIPPQGLLLAQEGTIPDPDYARRIAIRPHRTVTFDADQIQPEGLLVIRAPEDTERNSDA